MLLSDFHSIDHFFFNFFSFFYFMSMLFLYYFCLLKYYSELCFFIIIIIVGIIFDVHDAMFTVCYRCKTSLSTGWASRATLRCSRKGKASSSTAEPRTRTSPSPWQRVSAKPGRRRLERWENWCDATCLLVFVRVRYDVTGLVGVVGARVIAVLVLVSAGVLV